jgi:selenocysteine-specific elongation factor
MFVLGTAGHIDHGKSTLVKALTGIDPDRLREEKERQMTIDLGFAWMKLPSGREVGIVDVPGHERFVKNMLAGVGGIDVALLIIAANEGVALQTKEHLAIIDLLHVRKGIVVLTKKDTVDDELLMLVRMEAEELISRTTLAGSPFVAVSALTGEGLPELITIIDGVLTTLEPRRDLGRPRLAIDRVFTVAGAGTIVTGTLIDGSLTVGQEVEIVPAGVKSRIRSLQTHKAQVNTAEPGSRVAANLVGVSKEQLRRGDVLTKPGWLKPTTMLTVKLKLLSSAPRPLRHGAILSFHSGADEAEAKVRLLEGNELKPGGSAWAQIVLEKKVAVVDGDYFIIRSPMETLGGGRIIDAHPKRLTRFRRDILDALNVREAGSAEDVVLSLLDSPMEYTALLSRASLPAEDVKSVLDSLIQQQKVVRLGESEQSLLMTAVSWDKFAKRAASLLQEYHQKYPARPGMPRVELGSKLKMGTYAPLALQKLVKDKAIVEEGVTVRLPSHRIRLTAEQQARIDNFLRALAHNPYSPPGDITLEPDVLALLVEQGKVVKVSDAVVFSAAAYKEMVAKVTAHIRAHGKVTLAEVRDMFQTSRKYAQALLEYLDSKKVTRRVGDERVLF